MSCPGLSKSKNNFQINNELLFRGPTFIEYLDGLPSFNRSIEGPLRMPIVERYKVCSFRMRFIISNEI